MKPDVVTVSFGNPDLLLPLLRSLELQSKDIGVIYLWHNGPRAFDRAALAPFTSLRIEVDECDQNLGYGAGVNRGFAKSRAEIIVVVNPDVALAPDCIRQLANQFVSDPAPVLVGGLLTDAEARVNAHGLSLTFDGLGIDEARGHMPEAVSVRVARPLAPSGALFAVSKGRWHQLGGAALFPESLFLYMEDVALGIKVRRMNAVVAFCPEARGIHEFSESTGRRSPLKLYQVERNRLWILRSLRGRKHALFTFPFTLLRFAAYVCPVRARGAIKGAPGGLDPRWALVLARAWRDGLCTSLPDELSQYWGETAPRSLRGYYAPLAVQLRDPTR